MMPEFRRGLPATFALALVATVVVSAFVAGKSAEKSLEVSSTVGALAFAPKGVRLRAPAAPVITPR